MRSSGWQVRERGSSLTGRGTRGRTSPSSDEAHHRSNEGRGNSRDKRNLSARTAVRLHALPDVDNSLTTPRTGTVASREHAGQRVPHLKEHRLRKRFDRRKTVAPSVSWLGNHERADPEPERADEIGSIRIMDNGSETVQRVTATAQYIDHLEARSLVRGCLRRAWDSNPQVLSDNGFQVR